ncbi:hypothetical protein ABZX92_08870 [Lentzea sp. NPDC006480]
MNDHTPHTGDATTEDADARPVIKTVLTANPNRTKAPRQEVDR